MIQQAVALGSHMHYISRAGLRGVVWYFPPVLPISTGAVTVLDPGLGLFFQAEDGIRAGTVTGVQTCALPILMTDHGYTQVRSFTRMGITLDAPPPAPVWPEIGRASCRERVYVVETPK